MPSLLGDDAPVNTLSATELELLEKLRYYYTENERSARRFLRKAGYTGSLEEIQMHRLDKDTSTQEQSQLLQILRDGNDVGLISEAGSPAVADPGAGFIQLAHSAGIEVVPVPGPSAIFLAIMASGLNGQQFSFNGYLPIDTSARIKTLRSLEEQSARTGYAQFFIETPYRNKALLDDILKTLHPSTLLSISLNLTVPGGWSKTRTVKYWKGNLPEIQKIPAIFGLMKK